jgi:hypothetical protein
VSWNKLRLSTNFMILGATDSKNFFRESPHIDAMFTQFITTIIFSHF